MRPLYIIFILLGSVSCAPDRLSADELTIYIDDEANGLKKSTELGSTKIEVSYRPADLLVYQELGGKSISEDSLKQIENRYSQYAYFRLSLSTRDREALHQTGQGKYGELVQTLSFRMHEFVSLTTSAGDTIPVSDFMLNRTFDLNGSTDLLFSFNNEKISDKEWIQFNLNEFGLGIGLHRFRFEKQRIQECPSINFSEKQ